jgi:diguanylate cyclase (GGDEF)-like protein
MTAEGDFVVASVVDISDRKRRETKLSEELAELGRSRAEMVALGDLAALLQHAEVAGEAEQIVAEFAGKIFPDSPLGVYVRREKELERVATSGAYQGPSNIHPSNCWAVRRGQAHRNLGGAPCCSHIPIGESAMCMPMSARGQILGILCLKLSGEATRSLTQVEPLLKAVADHLGMAITNIELQARLIKASVRDPLTNLYNRRYLSEAAEQEMARARRNNQSLSVMILDIDHFKRYNDVNGHPAADDVLRELATFLLTQSRREDVVCRFGGEEFLLLLTGMEIEEAGALAERMRLGVERHFGGSITLSIGVATFPECAQEWERLVRRADQALYEAKNRGRNQVMLARPT